ncbi:tRNA pseudouridine(55) synthase TruB [Candidatus Parcubacteria bacterium]|nr:tRNA pseudouridine(55) synthase TruB [Candidatus Parcubacteria bacterium]
MIAEKNKSGFLLIDKPSGPTSHDIIDKLRRITGIKKIGHAGTLDPFASGLLIVAVGREATREINKFVKLDKIYEAELRLGAKSDTHDRTGNKQRTKSKEQKTQEQVTKVLGLFIGRQEQVPPMYSAKKVGGKKLYQLARQGKTIERWAEEIEIFNIELLDYKWPELKIKIHSSSGTYIRALARDIGKALGCGALLTELERTAIGEYKLGQASQLSELNSDNWQENLI